MADKLVNGGYVNNAIYFCKWTTWAFLSPHAWSLQWYQSMWMQYIVRWAWENSKIKDCISTYPWGRVRSVIWYLHIMWKWVTWTAQVAMHVNRHEIKQKCSPSQCSCTCYAVERRNITYKLAVGHICMNSLLQTSQFLPYIGCGSVAVWKTVVINLLKSRDAILLFYTTICHLSQYNLYSIYNESLLISIKTTGQHSSYDHS